jgi:hypothetical protein
VQAYEAEYQPQASSDILKWKPASHNSVDFTLLPAAHAAVRAAALAGTALPPDKKYFLGVLSRRVIVLAYDFEQDARGAIEQTQRPARVRFAEGEQPEAYVGLVVECNYDRAARTWCFMRERSKCAPAQPVTLAHQNACGSLP